MDEGDPFCSVRVAIASNQSWKHAPLDIKKLQKQFTQAGVKCELVLSSRPPDAKHRTITDWFLLVYSVDVPRARHLVNDAITKGLHVSADYTSPKPVGQ